MNVQHLENCLSHNQHYVSPSYYFYHYSSIIADIIIIVKNASFEVTLPDSNFGSIIN